jgi:hypothetical protein
VRDIENSRNKLGIMSIISPVLPLLSLRKYKIGINYYCMKNKRTPSVAGPTKTRKKNGKETLPASPMGMPTSICNTNPKRTSKKKITTKKTTKDNHRKVRVTKNPTTTK